MNKWQVIRYVVFLAAFGQAIVTALVADGENVAQFDYGFKMGSVIFLIMAGAVYFFSQAMVLQIVRFLEKGGSLKSELVEPDVKSCFFSLSDPAHFFHLFLFMLGGAVCGFVVSGLLQREFDYIFIAAFFFFGLLGIKSGIKKMGVIYKERYLSERS